MARSTPEPIAIIGMACRFPGANDIESFWRLLEEGRNAVTEGVPGSGVGRWGLLFGDEAVASEGCRYGAFVDDIELFDDAFFRISPVEAQLLDPQQRMMLEVTWQALEDAGIDPERIRGSRTGVYSGISNDEYRMMVVDSAKPTEAAACLYALSGTNLNGTAGRVSFVLGLTGPAKAVDAACASAMVAINDAVADLQQGKANLAIAGGVQAILNGRIYELRADAMMLSPDGQCKTFDASANGYVRAEGCGVVVLKRLSEAEADGDRIWAVIRSSVVNHGGAGVGLTVPNTPALEQVMEDALSQAGVEPLEVEYIEAHGTGTTVGDPIEINAVSAVYCRGRSADQPLLIGSVKTNVGHLESAAGVVGLIKAALVVKRGVIPKHLHFRDPNPALDWDSLPLRVTSDMMEWPDRPGRSRMAGVNCFGISGTNAHMVVEEYRGPDGVSAGEYFPAGAPRAVGAAVGGSADDRMGRRGTRLLPLSGKSRRRCGNRRDGILRGSMSMPATRRAATRRVSAAEAPTAARIRARCSRTWLGRPGSDGPTSNTARGSSSMTRSRCGKGSRRWTQQAGPWSAEGLPGWRSRTPAREASGGEWDARSTRANPSLGRSWTAARRCSGRSAGPRCWTSCSVGTRQAATWATPPGNSRPSIPWSPR